jgi:hypothetical protein
MDIVGRTNNITSEYIRELLMTVIPHEQISHAMSVLKSGRSVGRLVRDICAGGYILLHKDRDDLFEKIKVPISQTTSNITEKERDSLNEVLNQVKIDLSKQLEKSSLSDSTAENAPPRLYDKRGLLNEPYRDLLKSIGITTWLLHYRNEKPVEVWGLPSEIEFKDLLLKADKAKAERLLLFTRYKHLNAPLIVQFDALVAGSTFNEEDFNFSPSAAATSSCPLKPVDATAF